MSDTPELKPCPFCGNALIQTGNHPVAFTHQVNAKCMLSQHGIWVSGQRGFAAWNLRASTDADSIADIVRNEMFGAESKGLGNTDNIVYRIAEKIAAGISAPPTDTADEPGVLR